MTPADPRAAFRRDLAIRIALLRQRSPSVLRGLMDKNRLEQERATSALLEAIMQELDRYTIEERPQELRPAPTTF